MLTLDEQQKQRMMLKIDRAISPMQATLKSYTNSKWANVLEYTARGNDPYTRYYTGLAIYRAGVEVPIDAHATGSWIMRQVREIASMETAREIGRTGSGFSVFLVMLKNTNPDITGHAIGIHLTDPGELHFFDPNFGEFLFPPRQDEEFLDEWWQRFYRKEFDLCAVEPVSLA